MGWQEDQAEALRLQEAMNKANKYAGYAEKAEAEDAAINAEAKAASDAKTNAQLGSTAQADYLAKQQATIDADKARRAANQQAQIKSNQPLADRVAAGDLAKDELNQTAIAEQARRTESIAQQKALADAEALKAKVPQAVKDNNMAIQALQEQDETNPDSVGSQPKVTSKQEIGVGGTTGGFTPLPLKNKDIGLAKNDIQLKSQDMLRQIDASAGTPAEKAELKKQVLQREAADIKNLKSTIVEDKVQIFNSLIDRTKPDADQKAWEAYDKAKGITPESKEYADRKGKPFPWGTINPGTPDTAKKDVTTGEFKPAPVTTPEAAKAIEEVKKTDTKKTEGEWDWLANIGRNMLFLVNAVATGQSLDPKAERAYQAYERLGQQDKENAMNLAKIKSDDAAQKQSALDKVADLTQKEKMFQDEMKWKTSEGDKDRAVQQYIANLNYNKATAGKAPDLASIIQESLK